MNLKNYMIILGRSRNLSLRDMAKQLGFSPAHLSDVINGKRSFLKNLYDKICETFNLDWVEKMTLEKYVVGNKEYIVISKSSNKADEDVIYDILSRYALQRLNCNVF